MISKEKISTFNLFRDPKKRGQWFDHIFGSQQAGCPNFAIDSKTGTQTSEPSEVKRIYLEEGAKFLRNRIECPPPFKSEEYIEPEPPPDLTHRPAYVKQKPKMLPKWWSSMYNRNAKRIEEKTWEKLMETVGWKEIFSTIMTSESGKAAGYDGVSSDLIRLLTEDSKDEPTPLLEILTLLVNIALKEGQTLPSWRKAIVSMIPKKKDD